MSSINNVSGVSPYLNTTTPTSAAAKAAEETKTTPSIREDIYTPSGTVDKDKINEMKAELNGNIAAFRAMVEKSIGKQSSQSFTSLSELLSNIEVDEETRLEAAASIAEDGYWGVEQTAERILDFAKALSGGDPSKIDKLQAAVLKGFEAAEKTWGGKLMDISYQTLDRINEGFDEWRASFNSEAEIVEE